MEAVGVAISGASILAIFETAVWNFDIFQAGRHMDRDLETCCIKLAFAQLKLTRWEKAVEIDNPYGFKFLLQPPTSEDVERILKQIISLFNEAKGKAKCCGVDDNDGKEDTPTGIVNKQIKGLDKKLRKLAVQRLHLTKKAHQTWMKCRWALADKKELEHLANNAAGLVQDLVRLVPAARPEEMRLAEIDVVELNVDEDQEVRDALLLLRDLAISQESPMAEPLSRVIDQRTSHTFEDEDTRRSEEARLLQGDVAVDPSSTAEGKAHLYRNERLAVKDKARVMQGNQYGGKGFWD